MWVPLNGEASYEDKQLSTCMVSEKVNCYGGYHPVCGDMLCCTYVRILKLWVTISSSEMDVVLSALVF